MRECTRVAGNEEAAPSGYCAISIVRKNCNTHSTEDKDLKPGVWSSCRLGPENSSRDTSSHATSSRDTLSHAISSRHTSSHAILSRDTSTHAILSRDTSSHAILSRDRLLPVRIMVRVSVWVRVMIGVRIERNWYENWNVLRWKVADPCKLVRWSVKPKKEAATPQILAVVRKINSASWVKMNKISTAIFRFIVQLHFLELNNMTFLMP